MLQYSISIEIINGGVLLRRVTPSFLMMIVNEQLTDPLKVMYVHKMLRTKLSFFDDRHIFTLFHENGNV